LPRHLGGTDAIAVELLVVVHGNGDPQQSAGELERRGVMRHRAGAITPDVEAGPRDDIMESELGLDRSGGFAVDQQRIDADPGPCTPGRRRLAHHAFDMHAEAMRSRQEAKHCLRVSGGAGHAGQHHPQRSGNHC
jgi:hypothetical protein